MPPELTQILEGLRERAHTMPPVQLERVLVREWGKDWRARVAQFDMVPIAAASIGQVHRATASDGRKLAIKIQYPGVRESIDSDVDNVASLLRMSGLLPPGMNVRPLLDKAKRQLHEEADYMREGEQIQLFGRLLSDTQDVAVPEHVAELSTDRVLAMTYLDGIPIEAVATATQPVRDHVASALIGLVLRELFEFGVMQTDPNFANYRYQSDTGRVVLLDFGAARRVETETVAVYRALLRASLAADGNRVREAALEAGILGRATVLHHRARIDGMIEIILKVIGSAGPIDFGDRDFVATLRDGSLEIAADQRAWHVPPADILFTQRKVGGMALLASLLKARVDARALAAPYV